MGAIDPTSGPPERRVVLDELHQRLSASVHSVVPAGAPVALLGFPNHPNVGDSAIWVGERALLRELGHSVVYVAEQDYSRSAIQRVVRNGVVLLHGGGNLGDVWVAHQRFRERVVRDFPDLQIVQLPQTVHFRDDANVERCREVFSAHGNVTVLCRDRRSHAFVSERLTTRALLAPDAAFAMGPLARPAPRPPRVRWLARTDEERIGPRLAPGGSDAAVVDWLEDPRRRFAPDSPRARETAQRWERVFARPGALAIRGRAFPGWLFDRHAAARVEAGRRILGEADVVVTDRLHGHILALLLYVPHVVLDTGYGKVRDFIETWTHSLPQVLFAETAVEASLLARDLLDARGPAGST